MRRRILGSSCEDNVTIFCHMVTPVSNKEGYQLYPQYIDSGISWLGKIPRYWAVRRLKFATKKIVGGGTPDTSIFRYWTDGPESGYPWVTIADITESDHITTTKKYITDSGLKDSSAQLVDPKKVLYSIYASLGKVALSETALTTNQAILAIYERPELLNYKFLFWLMKSAERYILTYGTTNTQNNISLAVLKNLDIVLPPIIDQQKIAAYLDEKTAAIDGAIEKKRRQIELLKEKRTALINQTVTKGLDPKAELVDSGIPWLGKIPMGWGVKRLKYVAEMNRRVLPENTDPDFQMKYVDISNVESGGAISEPSEHRFADAPSRARRIVMSHDTIIATVRTYLKAIAFIEQPEQNTIVSTGFAVLTATDQILPKYLYYHSISEAFVQHIVSNSFGVSYPAITPTLLGSLPVRLPPKSEQQKIAAYLDEKTAAIDGVIEKIDRSIGLLTEYKSSLITNVVTGKVKVS